MLNSSKEFLFVEWGEIPNCTFIVRLNGRVIGSISICSGVPEKVIVMFNVLLIEWFLFQSMLLILMGLQILNQILSCTKVDSLEGRSH